MSSLTLGIILNENKHTRTCINVVNTRKQELVHNSSNDVGCSNSKNTFKDVCGLSLLRWTLKVSSVWLA